MCPQSAAEEVGLAAYPRDHSLTGVFAHYARTHADRPAILTENRVITYRELDTLSDRVAARLAAAGVTPGSRVGVVALRSPETVIGWLAALKCGAAYVPFDPTYPADAIAFMLADSAPAAMLTQSWRADFGETAQAPRLALPAAVPQINIAEAMADASAVATRPVGQETSAMATAYVMYTSGSTGRPKGVMIPHRAVVRLVRAQTDMAYGDDEVFLLSSALSFDVCTWEVWGALLNGAQLAIVERQRLAISDLATAIRRFGVTSLHLTAGLFNVVVDTDPTVLAPLRRVFSGGDVMSPDHANRAVAALPGVAVINDYGPTEATMRCANFALPAQGWHDGPVPIGKAIAHDRLSIRDDAGAPIADGETGFLWVGGDGVALGYLNRPELTAERFLPDPDSADGGLMYNTGDLARVRPDGLITCLGRVDRQVKIDGKRIELDEVEFGLRTLDGVEDAAVALEERADGGKRMIAFVRPRQSVRAAGAGDGSSPLDAFAARVQAAAAERMVAHLVPHLCVGVAAFPLTAANKTDRKALLAQFRAQPTDTKPPREFVAGLAASGQTSEQTTGQTSGQTAGQGAGLGWLIAAWCGVLGRSDVAADDNFFTCGGTSLALVKLHAICERQMGQAIPVTLLFGNPTPRSQARALAALSNGQQQTADGANGRAGTAGTDAQSGRAARARGAMAKRRAARRERGPVGSV